MYVIQVAAEIAPVAKVGGLADVVFGLTRELEARGHDVEVILPKYDCMWYDQIWGLHRVFDDLWVPWYGGAIHASVYFGWVHGRKCFFIEPHSADNFFNRGTFYGCKDDLLRFVFFSRAALEFLYKSGKRPDVIHCHDWQTGLVPVLLFEIYQSIGMPNQRVCYTMHNLRHQGVGGGELLWATRLGRPEYYFHHDRLRDNTHVNALNLMKGGLVYANFATTVSPHHAWEVRHTEQGYGLQASLNVHQAKFGGVLNGCDYDVWNPEKDWHLARHYGAASIEDKYLNKEALRERLWLRKGWRPIVAYVGRLDAQKGVALIRHGIHFALQLGAQFVLLGSSPDAAINREFWELKRQLDSNPDVHLELAYSDQLAHMIYAGADLVLVPSIYEPCGLTQMMALRYGAVPIVRAVGGLADTVFDRDFGRKPPGERNGYVFDHPDAAGLESAMRRAIGLWFDYPADFRQLMVQGMCYDYSWNYPGQHYVNIYEHIRAK
ncbi:MAG: glycogen synthase [Proteobacteria bacterium]|nr:glycogen synthase [Pseudomonadota bacterium]